MKFKQGRLTICPAELVGSFDAAKPAMLQHWDEALAVPTPQDLGARQRT